MRDIVGQMIRAAASRSSSSDALNLSQAALNIANALVLLDRLPAVAEHPSRPTR